MYRTRSLSFSPFRRNMAKRKINCSLDDVVKEYLKKVKCDKTSKMFGTEHSIESDQNKISTSMREFQKFLKKKTKENDVEDDLGFEINFGAFQPEKKLLLRNSLFQKANHGSKKESERRKKDVPKDFIKKIKHLGMRVEDAQVLFMSKIDWCAVYSENKIYCVEPGCDYFTTIENEELTNHMIDVHKYGDYPCNYDHCNYVATSKVSPGPC